MKKSNHLMPLKNKQFSYDNLLYKQVTLLSANLEAPPLTGKSLEVLRDELHDLFRVSIISLIGIYQNKIDIISKIKVLPAQDFEKNCAELRIFEHIGNTAPWFMNQENLEAALQNAESSKENLNSLLKIASGPFSLEEIYVSLGSEIYSIERLGTSKNEDTMEVEVIRTRFYTAEKSLYLKLRDILKPTLDKVFLEKLVPKIEYTIDEDKVVHTGIICDKNLETNTFVPEKCKEVSNFLDSFQKTYDSPKTSKANKLKILKKMQETDYALQIIEGMVNQIFLSLGGQGHSEGVRQLIEFGYQFYKDVAQATDSLLDSFINDLTEFRKSLKVKGRRGRNAQKCNSTKNYIDPRFVNRDKENALPTKKDAIQQVEILSEQSKSTEQLGTLSTNIQARALVEDKSVINTQEDSSVAVTTQKLQELTNANKPVLTAFALKNNQRKRIESINVNRFSYSDLESLLKSFNIEINHGAGSRRKADIFGTTLCLHQGHGKDRSQFVHPEVTKCVIKLLAPLLKQQEQNSQEVSEIAKPARYDNFKLKY